MKLIFFSLIFSLLFLTPSHAMSENEVREVFSTTLTSEGQEESWHFPALWTSANPGYIVTAKDSFKVIKSVTFSFNATPFRDVNNAGIDACLYVSAPSDTAAEDKLTVTQNEILCFNQHKGTESQWPEPSLHVEFPGQGIFVPKGSLIACDSQGGLPQGAVLQPNSEDGQRAEFSDFECEVVLKDYDPTKQSGVAFQSVRAPFFDEAFKKTPHSRTASHKNLTNRSLRIRDVWIYDNTLGKENRVCLNKGNNLNACRDKLASTNPNTYTTSTKFQDFYEYWGVGESLTATCTSHYNEVNFQYCAFYFMVEIDDENGLTRNNTISYDEVTSYCDNPYPCNYVLTSKEHGYVVNNEDQCLIDEEKTAINRANCERVLLD